MGSFCILCSAIVCTIRKHISKIVNELSEFSAYIMEKRNIKKTGYPVGYVQRVLSERSKSDAQKLISEHTIKKTAVTISNRKRPTKQSIVLVENIEIM